VSASFPVTARWADEQLNAKLGLELLEVSVDRVVGTIPVAGNRQPAGLLHGGANALLAETLASVAATLYGGHDRIAVGLELSCTHHRPALDGLVTGVCTPLHLGRSTATYDVVITDTSGRRTCTARVTCVLPPRPAGT
jgi:1,4-dihydroxy-2-naphthoyl-CoA hydrolase